MHFYRPQRSSGKVMFLHVSVILFTLGSGRQTPPPADKHPRQADTPSPWTATAADGTHPTGMHSCKKCGWSHALLASREDAHSPSNLFSFPYSFRVRMGKYRLLPPTHPFSSVWEILDSHPGADPGFPVGGSVNIQFCQIFQKKLHEIENILGCRAPPPPTPS